MERVTRHHVCDSQHGALLGRWVLWVGGFAVALPMFGCARQLTITQDPYINTAMHGGRKPDGRTGEPLEVNVVCVYPQDLDKPENAQLAPSFAITSDMWYAKRPTHGGAEPGKFELPPQQVYLFTEATNVYGKKVGPRLKGAVADGKAEISLSGGINFEGPYHNDRSVIYLFPKFVDAGGNVLSVPPVKWHPPGAFTHNLFCKIGVRDPAGAAEQYTENTTPRKLGKE